MMDSGLFRYIEAKCWSGRTPVKFAWSYPADSVNGRYYNARV